MFANGVLPDSLSNLRRVVEQLKFAGFRFPHRGIPARIVSAPLGFGHEDWIGVERFFLYQHQNTNLRMRSALTACLKQRLRHGNHGANGGAFHYPADDVPVRRISKDAFREYNSQPSAISKQLKAPIY